MIGCCAAGTKLPKNGPCPKCGAGSHDPCPEAYRIALKERDALVKALEQCRTSYCGYAITKSEQYPDVLASFWKEIKRIDGIARAALETIKVPS